MIDVKPVKIAIEDEQDVTGFACSARLDPVKALRYE